MINHLVDGSGGRVTEIAVLRALSFAQYLESHARRAYGSGLNVEVGTAKSILERIRKGHEVGDFTARPIQRRDWSNLTDKDQNGAELDLLDDLGSVRSRRIETGGRPNIVVPGQSESGMSYLDQLKKRLQVPYVGCVGSDPQGAGVANREPCRFCRYKAKRVDERTPGRASFWRVREG